MFTAVSGEQPGTAVGDIVLSAMNESTGAVVWRDTLTEQVSPNSLIAANGVLYLDGAGKAGTVYAITESSGAPMDGLHVRRQPAHAGREHPGAHRHGRGFMRPERADGCIDLGAKRVILRRRPRTRLVRPSVSPLWTFNEPQASTDPMGSMPLLADGYVFAEGSHATVWALNACTGASVWSGSAGSNAPYEGFDPLPGLSAGDGYLIAPAQIKFTASRGSGMPTGPAPVCAG